MELVPQARELGCWAAEEMRVPAASRAPESTFRRLCLGQGADIWAYILQHVHSQSSVKKIRGNLLWPCLVLDMLRSLGHKTFLDPCIPRLTVQGSQKSTDVMAHLQVCKKLELETTAARLRTDIQELDQSMELMVQETESQGLAGARKMRIIILGSSGAGAAEHMDNQHRALLVAQTGAKDSSMDLKTQHSSFRIS